MDLYVGTKGDSYDNALAETINGLYKAKVIEAIASLLSKSTLVSLSVRIIRLSLKSSQSLTATRVAPPCCVTLGLHRSLTAPLENDSSVALLDHT